MQIEVFALQIEADLIMAEVDAKQMEADVGRYELEGSKRGNRKRRSDLELFVIPDICTDTNGTEDLHSFQSMTYSQISSKPSYDQRP